MRCIGVFLLLGLAATLFTAWPLPLMLLRYGMDAHQVAPLRSWTAPSGVHCGVRASHLTLSDAIYIRPVQERDSFLPLGEPVELPRWVASPPKEPPLAERIDTGATGWPFRALASEYWLYRNQAGAAEPWREELRWCTVLLSTSRGRIMLPYRPVWPGLLADTAIYSAVLFGCAFSFASLRRSFRLRRGGCPRCGYSLRATPSHYPCPECGAPARSPSQEPA